MDASQVNSDLLEACKAALDWITGTNEQTYEGYLDAEQAEKEKLRAAIAKAEPPTE